MDPVQVYETTIYNRDRAGEAFRFLTVPARSLPGRERPSFEQVSRTLGFQRPRGRRLALVEPWLLPWVIDAALTGDPDFPYWLEFGPPFRGRTDRPSSFAQYLAYEPVIPFES